MYFFWRHQIQGLMNNSLIPILGMKILYLTAKDAEFYAKSAKLGLM